MASYTIQVRTLCENAAKTTSDRGYDTVEETIDAALWFIFDFNFPIFDENYRSVLERKILRHFYNYEICAETTGLWKQYLCTKMNEIMPYYNSLYRTNDLIIEPLIDVDYIRQTAGGYARNTNRNEHGTSRTDYTTDGSTAENSNNTAYGRFSDTPQGALTNVDNDQYLTSATKDTSNGSSTSTNHSTTINDTNRNINGVEDENGSNNNETRMKGSFGGRTKAAMLKEYRETLLNIDMMIINELEPLFMQIW